MPARGHGMCKGKEAKERIWSVDISKTGTGAGSCQDEVGGPPRGQLIRASNARKDPGLYSESHGSQGQALSKGVA